MQFVRTFIFSSALAVAALTSVGGFAQDPSRDITEGEIRKVDKDAGKLTIKHADIRNLDMPAMTMVFLVKDKAMLDTVKAGDKIKFKALSENGKLVATEIQPDK